MRVGVLTSWRVPCGIYQYSSRLVEALARIDGVEPVVLAGRADEHRSVPEEWDGEVHDVAKIGLWRDDGQYELDLARIGELGLDVIHVQYQSMLFHQESLDDLAQCHHGARLRARYMAVTFHDNCQRPDFPYSAFDLHFSHRWNVGPPSVEVIPFGIEDRPPVVRSFGLGRTQSELVEPICQRHGWIYESAASHEPIRGGGQSWKPHEELIQWLRGADAIVLWYPEQDMAGSSQAARTAMATRRPVFTNDTKWFEDLPGRPRLTQDGAVIYEKIQTLEQLDARLAAMFHRPYVMDNSWDLVAAHMVGRYGQSDQPARRSHPVITGASSKPLVSICIPTLDRRSGRVDKLLDSIKQHTQDVLYETIVEDCQGELRGYTRPMNKAVGRASAPYIVAINDDVTVTDGWLMPLIEALRAGAWCVTPDATHTDGPQIFHPWLMAWSRWAWSEIGGLDDQFALWCSDIDIARRLVDAGHPPVKVLLPTAVAHQLNATSQEHPELGQVCLTDLALFKHKWGVDAETEKHRLASLCCV